MARRPLSATVVRAGSRPGLGLLRREDRRKTVGWRLDQLSHRVVYLDLFLLEPGVNPLDELAGQDECPVAVGGLEEDPKVDVGIAEL